MFDKSLFAAAFNLRSAIFGTTSRLKWHGGFYRVSDSEIPGFSYQIAEKKQANLSYFRGIRARAESLAQTYFLDAIDFADGDTVIDCGANVGDFSIWFRIRGVDIEYVGFEPAPVEFECLAANVAPSRVFQLGLWHSSGEFSFYVSSSGADSSFTKPKTYDRRITAKTVALESFIDSRVRLIKLEAEGSELEVLQGIGSALENVDYIAADVGPERGENLETTVVPVTNYLLARNFELIAMSHTRICALYKNRGLELPNLL